MAVSIVGILAGLAIPNLRSMTFRARATSVAGDIEVVRISTACPWASIITLEGFKSRCTMPVACAWTTACAIRCMNLATTVK